jgi:hypothetical protein
MHIVAQYLVSPESVCGPKVRTPSRVCAFLALSRRYLGLA